MKEEDFQWLKANQALLGNVRMIPEDLARIFIIYNDITGEGKPITSCGRCVLNIKKRLKFEYEKLQSIRD
tara:strand:+ start:931 stop:1140 length:210 start_codon:yes stop_codon:yes gene_type:complete